MFKNYLSYSMAQSFHRSCMTLHGIDPLTHERIMRSSETLIHHFALSIHARDSQEEAKNLAVALLALRDCREVLDAALVSIRALDQQYFVLHARLEQLCGKNGSQAGAQLKLLG